MALIREEPGMSGKGFIADEKPQQCELCKRAEECRPYGPNGEQVCFECASKDPVAMDRGFQRHVLGRIDS
jgi:hypothetical protein